MVDLYCKMGLPMVTSAINKFFTLTHSVLSALNDFESAFSSPPISSESILSSKSSASGSLTDIQAESPGLWELWETKLQIGTNSDHDATRNIPNSTWLLLLIVVPWRHLWGCMEPAMEPFNFKYRGSHSFCLPNPHYVKPSTPEPQNNRPSR